MKFSLSFLASAIFVSCASAQQVSIASPVNGATVNAGSNVLVEIDQPDFLSSAVNVAIVIGISPCISGVCPSPQNTLGSILFNGPFSPQRNPTDPPSKPPHQNFNVTIPAFLEGETQLAAYHVLLTGAANSPATEFKTITLNVQ